MWEAHTPTTAVAMEQCEGAVRVSFATVALELLGSDRVWHLSQSCTKCAHLSEKEGPALKERNGNRQMSVILRATGSVPAARLAVQHTQVCARGRFESTAVPVWCQAAGLVAKTFSAGLNWLHFGLGHASVACLHSRIGSLCVYALAHSLFISLYEENKKIGRSACFSVDCCLTHNISHITHPCPS